MKENLKLGAILLVITLAAGVLLGFANELTKEQIALNSRVSKDDLEAIMPDADSIKETEFEINEEVVEVYEAMKGSENVGHIFKVAVKGFKGPINFVVGIDNDDIITGIKILSHTETPGLGSKIEEDNFREQFAGKGTEQELETVKSTSSNEGEIEAISGATVSSKAATNAVNLVINYYKEEIKGEAVASKPNDKYSLELNDERLLTLLPDATSIEEEALELPKGILKVYEGTNGDQITGYAIMVVGEGFYDDVVLLVGINAEDILTGLEVVFQDETQNLGSLVEEEEYRSQFDGKAVNEELEIEAISGATVTSDAAETAINNAINYYLNELKK